MNIILTEQIPLAAYPVIHANKAEPKEHGMHHTCMLKHVPIATC